MPVANWRATASMPKVPPPGTTTAGLRVVRLLQDARDVAHHALELLRHVVERAVGEDDRVFEQAVGVDVGEQAGHGVPSHRAGKGVDTSTKEHRVEPWSASAGLRGRSTRARAALSRRGSGRSRRRGSAGPRDCSRRRPCGPRAKGSGSNVTSRRKAASVRASSTGKYRSVCDGRYSTAASIDRSALPTSPSKPGRAADVVRLPRPHLQDQVVRVRVRLEAGAEPVDHRGERVAAVAPRHNSSRHQACEYSQPPHTMPKARSPAAGRVR